MLGTHGVPGAHQNARVHKSTSLSLSTRRSAGFTLVEVLVALIVLVLGVLGAAAMMLTSLRDNKQSALRSQATALAYELGDLMRVNPNQEATFTGSIPTGVVAGCFTTGCAPSDMASSDYYQWIAKLVSPTPATGVPVTGLPNASWKICRDATNPGSLSTCDGLPTSPLVVKMKWDEKFNNGKFVTDLDPTATDRPNLVVALRPY